MTYLKQKAYGKCDMKKILEHVQDIEKRLRCQVTESCINKSKNVDDVLKSLQQYS